MIELFESKLKNNTRQSSKGNQLKWENGGFWYKADYTGYEGLSECVISHILLYSTLGNEEFVVYDPEIISYRKQVFNGAKSRNFLKKGWQIITLERLFSGYYGRKLTESIYRIQDEEKRLRFLVDSVKDITGLRSFGVYMNKLLTVDAFFLNEDRHLHNIAVLMNEKQEYDYCPIFDNGAGLLADTSMDYPLGENVYDLIDSVKAKTFSDDFDVQLDISEKLYGHNLKFSFTKKDVKRIIDACDIYPEEIRLRVETVIYDRMRKYTYLF